MSWKDNLRPASFRGVPFRIDTTGQAGGRRGQTYEFPKGDTPSDEDLGRRARRWSVSGWVIGDDCVLRAAALQLAVEAEGAGQLILPTIFAGLARCETYTRTERRQEGRLIAFDMLFIEAGTKLSARIAESTQAGVSKSAAAAEQTTAQSADKQASSPAPQPTPPPAPTPETEST